MPRRRRASAVELLDRVELIGVIVVVDTELDETARRVGRGSRAFEHVATIDGADGASGVLRERSADIAGAALDRAAT